MNSENTLPISPQEAFTVRWNKIRCEYESIIPGMADEGFKQTDEKHISG